MFREEDLVKLSGEETDRSGEETDRSGEETDRREEAVGLQD